MRSVCGALALWCVLFALTPRVDAQRKPDFTTYPVEHLFNRDYFGTVDTLNFIAASTRTLPDWHQCPNTTEYAVTVLREASPLAADSTTGRHRVTACCPAGHSACTIPGVDRAFGCCPPDTFCAYQQLSSVAAEPKFAYCTPSYFRDCYGQRCEDGYTCCPTGDDRSSVCVPHAGDPSDLEAVCGPAITYRSSYVQPIGGYVRDELAFRAPGQKIPSPPDHYIQAQGWNVTAGLSLVPPQYRTRRAKDRCHLADIMLETVVPRSVDNVTGVVILNATRLDYCCKPGSDFCVGNDGVFVGCYNSTAGESCCGRSICPSGVGDYQCCMFPGFTPTKTRSDEYICCPTGLQCCYGDPAMIAGYKAYPPPLAALMSPNARAYCGIPLDGVDCAMDRMAPASHLLLAGWRRPT